MTHDVVRQSGSNTMTLIAGMLPLALGSGPGSEERRAVAAARSETAEPNEA